MKIGLTPASLGLAMALLTRAALAAEPDAATRVLHLDDGPILSLIGSVEGPGGYDDFYRGSPIRPPIPLSQMTIHQVLEFQDRAVASGSRSSAAGRYQFIRGTLRHLVSKGYAPGHARFDAATQNHLARVMLAGCGFYDQARGTTEIGDCLSRVWAALPVMSGKNAGRSYFTGVAGNRALTTIPLVARAIDTRVRHPSLGAQPIPVDPGRGPMVAPRIRTAANYPDDGRMSDRIPLK